MLQRDPVVFAADGFDPTHEWDCVNERVVRRIAKRPVASQTQKSWRDRNADYFIARRIQERSKPDQSPEPLRLPPPLSRLPWDIAQDEFGVKGADFIGIFGTVLLRAAQDQFRAYPIDPTGLADTLHAHPAQDQIRPVRESVRVRMRGHEAGVSSTGPPV